MILPRRTIKITNIQPSYEREGDKGGLCNHDRTTAACSQPRPADLCIERETHGFGTLAAPIQVSPWEMDLTTNAELDKSGDAELCPFGGEPVRHKVKYHDGV